MLMLCFVYFRYIKIGNAEFVNDTFIDKDDKKPVRKPKSGKDSDNDDNDSNSGSVLKAGLETERHTSLAYTNIATLRRCAEVRFK